MSFRIWMRTAALLLAAAVSLPAHSQNHPKPPSRKVQPSSQKSQSARALPENLTLENGEVLPLADFVPRAEAALKLLQDIVARVRPPEIQQAATALNELNRRVNETAPNARKTIDLAKSSLQLAETRMQWTRERTQLETLDQIVTRYTASLDELSKQLRSARENWDMVSKAATEANIPQELLLRISGVQSSVTEVESLLRQESNSLILMQVSISEARKNINEIVERAQVAEDALRDQIFALDSPPLWSSLRGSDWQTTRQQFAVYYENAIARSRNFVRAYRAQLVVYFLFWSGMLLVITKLCRQDLAASGVELDPRFKACLQHPYAITLLLAVAFFGFVFPKQPFELARLIRMLAPVPVVLLGFSISKKQLHPFIAGLAAIYLVESLSLLLISGTLLRRFVALFTVIATISGLVYLRHRQEYLTTFISGQKHQFAYSYFRLAVILLGVGALMNVIGNMSLSDILGFGTILSLYFALVLYVFYATSFSVISALTVSGFGRKSRAIRLHGELVRKTSASYLRLICWVAWTIAALAAFQLYNQFVTGAKDAISRKWQIGAISVSLLDLLAFLLVLVASTLLAKLIRFMLNEEILPRTSVEPGLAQAGSRLTYSGLLILGMFLSLGAAGLELSKLTVLTGAFGVGLGFGLQNVVSNFVSGIILSIERPMKIGDLVQMETLIGEVTAIGFRSSKVRTFEGADVIVPNSDLVTKAFVNWSLMDNVRRTDIQIGVAYGTDPHRVLDLLHSIVTVHPQVLRWPEPLITFDQFGDSALIFTARFWSKLEPRIQIRSELNTRIQEEFQNNGIVIPYPQRDLHLKLAAVPEGQPPDPAVKQGKAVGTV